MSDDRFKQARRSLIDRNKQRRQQGGNDMLDDDFNEEEKTLMVSIDSVGGGPAAPPMRAHPPAPAPPPAMDDFADAATQMVDISEFEAQMGRVEESTMPHREALSLGNAPQHNHGQQVFSPAEPPSAQFVPDVGAAGHQGHTEFIHIDALSANNGHAPAQPSGSIADDPVLRQGYQFGPQSIQQGEVTLIFAQNALGRAVVLRQVWAGAPLSMPPELRERLTQLEALNAPRLVALNGVVASQSGVWAEMSKPEGYRLSAVLGQHGPQDPENVLIWLKEAAETLEAVHAAGLIYANLTPDALWIQPDNSIVVEPFDLFSFDKRGDLGDFGPPELRRPPQDRQLSPATDVYSLAAVMTAALTGMPFDPAKLGALEDVKSAKRLQRALVSNPAERPQSIAEFAGQFKTGGSALGKFNLDPSQLDIKVVAVIAVLLLGGFAGYMYWNQQQAQKAAARRAQAAIAKQIPGAEDEAGVAADEAGLAEAGAAPEDKNAPPQDVAVTEDSRLTVISSYRSNPPAETVAVAMAPDELAAKSTELLEQARTHMKVGDELAKENDQKDEFTAALRNVTESIRLHGGTPTEEEAKLLDELHERRAVRNYEEALRKRITEAITNNDIGDARRAYKSLNSIDYHARSVHFFDFNPTASVRSIDTETTQADDE